eukprot:scaffold4117_cov28-Prasinocladus_malaysianus.AAC.3
MSPQDTDKDLLPLMGCFTSLAVAVGRSFEEFAPHCYKRCCRMIAAQLRATHAHSDREEEVLVTCLDLLS